jgi:hypothetical protein
MGRELRGHFFFVVLFPHCHRHALENRCAGNRLVLFVCKRWCGCALHQLGNPGRQWLGRHARCLCVRHCRLRHAHDGVGDTIGFPLRGIIGMTDGELGLEELADSTIAERSLEM